MADKLTMPMSAVTQKLAFLGRNGSGKTYAAQKLAEQLLIGGAQCVALDPVGVWYGLRIAADGQSPGLQLPVFGGMHGDVPLEATGGALMADLIVDRAISAVLDVSHFELDEEKALFATEFATRLFFRRKADPRPTMVFLEEAQEFIPEQPGKGGKEMLRAFARMIKIGRNYGIGAALISLRPQDISKQILNLTECMFTFQMTGPHEREVIRKWVARSGVDLDIVDELPRYEVGQCHVWSQQWLKVSKTIRIAAKQTFDASSTPQFGAGKRIEPIPLEASDLTVLRRAMADTVARAEAHDPVALRKKVAELEAKLAKAAPDAKIREMEVHHAAELQRIRATLRKASEMLAELPGTIEATREYIDPLWRTALDPVLVLREETPDPPARAAREDSLEIREGFGPNGDATTPGFFIRQPSATQNGALSGPAQRVVNALAQLEGLGIREAPLAHVALMAHYTHLRSKNFRDALGDLSVRGWISTPRVHRLSLTALGRRHADAVNAPHTAAEFHSRVIALLGDKSGVIVRALVDQPAHSLPVVELANMAGYGHTRSHGFREALKRLRDLRFIDITAGSVTATKSLLMEDR